MTQNNQPTPPPSGTVVDYDPLQQQGQGQPTPPPSGTAVDHDPALTANPRGQGVYQMKDQQGQVVGIPYSNVAPAATTRGYQFASDQDKFRYAKDAAADPNHSGNAGTLYTPVLSEQTPEGHMQAVKAREQSTPGGGAGQTAVGVMKGAGTLLKPVDDAIKVATGNNDPNDYTTAHNGYQEAGKIAGVAAGILPAAAEAPVAVATGLGTGTVSSMVGKVLGKHLGLNEAQSNLLADVFALAGGGGAAKLSSVVGGAIGGEEGAEAPGLLKEIFKGKDVNQPAAQNAVKENVASTAKATGTDIDTTQPILKGNTTILDEHLNALSKNAKAAYKSVDDVAGFDVKAEKAQLANDNYKLSQLGGTDADVTQRGNLIEAINDSTDRIAEAEGKLKAAGIDPKTADNIHQQLQAGKDFKKILVQTTDPDGSVNVDALLKQSKNLRFSKYGDRLSQYFGSPEAADAYMQQLQKAQDMGVHAMKVQTIAKWITGIAGVGGITHGLSKVASLFGTE